MSWEKVKLGELCTIEKGETGILKAIPGEYPLVVTGEERKTHNEFQFDNEAVIIPLVSGTGHGHASIKRIHYQTGKFALGSILCAIIPKDEKQLSAGYLYRFLELNKEKELVSRMKGMANVTLPIKEIAEIEIPLPSLEEQIHFVEKYNNLEDQTSKFSFQLTHQLTLVKQLRQALLREAMQGKLVPQNPEDEPASELLKRIKAEKEKLIAEKKLKKEKDLPPIKTEEIPFDIPENWVWCRLGEITIEILGGFAFDSTRYSKIETNNQVIRLGNVKPNRLILETSPVYIDDKYSREALKSILKDGDLLITMTGTRAKRDYLYTLSLCKDHFEGKTLFLNQRVGCFRFTYLVFNEFLNWALKDLRLIEPVYLSATGAANQANIGIEALKSTSIPLPSLPEQHRIVAKLEQLMQTCDALEDSIKESKGQNERLLEEVLREALREGK
jgi:type I restriction enzyme, S subunit